MNMISVENVQKTFGRANNATATKTLQDIDLTVQRGEFLCLLGPSGCGKSTLLNLIAGFENPTGGSLSVAGHVVKGPSAERGMVFQQPTLMPWLPVWENIAFSLKLRGVAKRERREKAQHYIEMVGLKGFEEHYPAQLSGGMSRKSGNCAGAAHGPGSHPDGRTIRGALDEQTKMDMQAELSRLWSEQNYTIVFVTHGIEEALILGTHVAVMSARPGQIVELLKIDLPRPRDVTSPSNT